MGRLQTKAFLSSRRAAKLLPYLGKFGSAFLLTCAALRGEYLPLGVCFFAACTGPGGLAALAGTAASALLCWDGGAALELLLLTGLVLLARLLFRGTAAGETKFFFPAVTAAASLLLSAASLASGGAAPSLIPLFLLRAGLCALAVPAFRRVLEAPTENALLLLTFCLLLSAARLRLGWFSPALCLAALLTAACAANPAGLAVAAVCGIALDCAEAFPVPVTALCCLSALLGRTIRSRPLAAACAAGVYALGGLALGRSLEFCSALPGLALCLCLPEALVSLPEKPRREPAVLQLEAAALLLAELGETLERRLPAEEPAAPSLIFDRAADRVCRTCPQFSACWAGPCEAYEALSRAAEPMLRRGAVLRDDFSGAFLARCRRASALLAAINQELDSVLYRRRFRHRLQESRVLLAGQYRLFAAYLQSAVASLSAEGRARPVCVPVVGVAAAGKKGSEISGDRGASFRVRGHLHYILLCDGMGSGPEAGAESGAAVRLLRGLLTAGFRPDEALQLLNGVYLLRDDGAFSTVDLLEIDLALRRLRLYKWGSAPSYLKAGDAVKRLGTAAPPPGLEETGRAEQLELSLGEEEMLVLLSDGAESPETEERIRAYEGRSPKELAAGLLGEGEEDDRTVVALKLRSIAFHRQHTTNCAG